MAKGLFMTSTDVVDSKSSFRFSGHETFACRYAWLPKAYRALRENPKALIDEDWAMVELGIGKNMVRSLRFWVEVMGVAVPVKGVGQKLTLFANEIFKKSGFDPYLEDVRTLWLLHWNISSQHVSIPFAWRYLLNQWPYPELSRSEVLRAFALESESRGHSHSAITLSQHFDAFLHTYYSARGDSVAVEDSLDGPLVELGLLQQVGERKSDGGRWENVFAFRRESKPEITEELFDYCVKDFWERFWSSEDALTLREVALGVCSPGQVFKLPEEDIRARLDAYSSTRRGRPFSYQPSAIQGLVTRRKGAGTVTLADVYGRDASND
jgi:hypothetical protein